MLLRASSQSLAALIAVDQMQKRSAICKGFVAATKGDFF